MRSQRPGRRPPAEENGPGEDAEREWSALLEELRVILPGVQVLFGFLLTIPFTQRFAVVSPSERAVYYGTLLCAALSTTFLIAPSTHHRLRSGDVPSRSALTTAGRLALAGTVFLAVTISGVIWLVTSVLFGSTPAAVVAALSAGTICWLWYGLPLLRYH